MPENKSTNEELLSEMMIANHNLESVVRKMHEFGRTDELNELFNMFQKHYEDSKAEVIRRMTYGYQQQ